MKKYRKELSVLGMQILAYYMLPLFAGPTDAMGMVLLLLMLTTGLGFLIGVISKSWIKYLYPVVVAVAFLPSIFLYYDESALVHSLWYLVVSTVGLLIGVTLRAIVLWIKRRK